MFLMGVSRVVVVVPVIMVVSMIVVMVMRSLVFQTAHARTKRIT